VLLLIVNNTFVTGHTSLATESKYTATDRNKVHTGVWVWKIEGMKQLAKPRHK
jgi:hypothetical protein